MRAPDYTYLEVPVPEALNTLKIIHVLCIYFNLLLQFNDMKLLAVWQRKTHKNYNRCFKNIFKNKGAIGRLQMFTQQRISICLIVTSPAQVALNITKDTTDSGNNIDVN